MRRKAINSYRSTAIAISFILVIVLCFGGNFANAASSPVMTKNNKKTVEVQLTAKTVLASTVEIPKVSQSKTVETSRFEQLLLPVKGDQIALIKTKLGTIKIKLLINEAPKAVETFINRVNTGYYDGMSFNKLIGGSILQGGTNTQNTTINTSVISNFNEYNPDIRNYRGAVSIASGDSGSIDQFVIVQAGPAKIVKDTLSFMKSAGETQFPKQIISKYQKVGGAPWMDFHNVIFGQVFSGMDVVDKIAKSAVDENNKMKKEVKIIKITIETKK